jgi:F0F1-type ATP synthase membrane subunit b/b'
MTPSPAPVSVQEVDTPEKLLRDINTAIAEMHTESTQELSNFITAIESVHEKLRTATEELDQVVAEMKAVSSEEIPEADTSAHALLEEIERDEDGDDVL